MKVLTIVLTIAILIGLISKSTAEESPKGCVCISWNQSGCRIIQSAFNKIFERKFSKSTTEDSPKGCICISWSSGCSGK